MQFQWSRVAGKTPEDVLHDQRKLDIFSKSMYVLLHPSQSDAMLHLLLECRNNIQNNLQQQILIICINNQEMHYKSRPVDRISNTRTLWMARRARLGFVLRPMGIRCLIVSGDFSDLLSPGTINID